jgi:hypothetical protein
VVLSAGSSELRNGSQSHKSSGWVLVNALTGEVGTGSNMSGKATNQELAEGTAGTVNV